MNIYTGSPLFEDEESIEKTEDGLLVAKRSEIGPTDFRYSLERKQYDGTWKKVNSSNDANLLLKVHGSLALVTDQSGLKHSCYVRIVDEHA